MPLFVLDLVCFTCFCSRFAIISDIRARFFCVFHVLFVIPVIKNNFWRADNISNNKKKTVTLPLQISEVP